MFTEAIQAIEDRIQAAKCKPGSRVFIQTGVVPDELGIKYIDGYYADIVSRNVLAGSATVYKADGSKKDVPGHQIWPSVSASKE